jgi:hypothetical protein
MRSADSTITVASANRALTPCRTSALDQLVWLIGVSIADTRSHTAV